MTHKPLTLLFVAILLIGILSACSPAQPNEGTRNGGGLPQAQEENGQPSKPGDTQPDSPTATSGENKNNEAVPPMQGEVADSDVLETDFFGLGTVSYQVKDVALHKSWDELSLTADELSHVRSLEVGDNVMLVTITVTNMNVPADSDRAKETLMNCFHLYFGEELSGPNTRFSEPTYMDKPFRGEDGLISGKSYFQRPLPSPGESLDIVLGFRVLESEVEQLDSMALHLVHNLSGDSLKLIYNG